MDGSGPLRTSRGLRREFHRSMCLPSNSQKGQPAPLAANGGLSYMSFDRDGDAGTPAATEAALHQIAEGERGGGYRHARQGSSRPNQDQVGDRVS